MTATRTDLIDLCRKNLGGYEDAIRSGKLCACVVLQDDQSLLVLTTDGEDCRCDSVEDVVEFLARRGIENDLLTMPDWREGDIAPSVSEQIAIRWGLRSWMDRR